MKVLVIGASGFIGRAVCQELLAAEHEVTGLGRSHANLMPDAAGFGWRQGDLSKLADAASWTALLDGIDAVVNASGALQDGPRDDLKAAQQDAIIALIDACEAAGIRRYVQISAPGATPDAPTAFLRTKGVADDQLRQSRLDWNVLRPGLVLGQDAYGGTALLRALAAFPVVTPLVFAASPVQTVWLGDLTAAVRLLLDRPELAGQSHDLLHGERHFLQHLVGRMRAWLGFAPARAVIRLPGWLAGVTARIADAESRLGWRSPLRTTAMTVMRDGVTGDAETWPAATGMKLHSLDAMLRRMPATKQERQFARTQLLMPVIVLALAFLWLVSGLLGLFRLDAATAIVAPALGLEAATAAVIGGSIADLLIGLGLLIRPALKAACLAGLAVSAAYLIGATIWVPGLWLDPLGPLVKVIPAMALTLVLLALSEER